MSEGSGPGGIFRKAQDEEEQAKPAAAQAPGQEAEQEAADLDALFREALASGEVGGDIVAVDAHGREVAGRKRSNIFGG